MIEGILIGIGICIVVVIAVYIYVICNWGGMY